MRPIWKGAISFGLVNIPITLYPATRREELRFHFLRKKDLSPINNKRVAEADGKEVAWEDIVRGYQYEKGKFIVLEEDDFARVDIEATQTVDIQEFVDAEEINPIFFSKPYYMEPGKGGDKAYALLREVLADGKKLGIAKVVIKTREHLAAVEARGNALVLELMHFAGEIVDADELHVPGAAKIGKKETDMAKRLVDSMTGKWDPEKYKDDYKEKLMDVIEEKVAAGGKKVARTKKSKTPKATNVIDLVAVLQKSLREHDTSSHPKKATRHKKRAAKPRSPQARSRANLPIPGFVEPMKCKPATALPTGDGWLYELKFDGYRFLGATSGDKVQMWSRAENDFTRRFPTVAQALKSLKAQSVLVDGELVVTDDTGRPSFQLIQNADESTEVRAFLFDLLEIDGEDLKAEPLEVRRSRLAAILPKRSRVLFVSSELTGDSEQLLADVAANGLEGMIAKQRDSQYEAGQRSGAWRKVRCFAEQEFVIGGFTEPRGARSHFGSLLVGYYEGGELIYAGKVGTGFNEAMLASLRRKMLALRVDKSPFESLPTHRSRWGTTFTRDELARCTWVKPRLVAQVRFAEWTGDGVLRQPAFLGLREDKKARDVVRET